MNVCYYALKHETSFSYKVEVYESIMEVRLCPIHDDAQKCHSFQLTINPDTNIERYVDYLGNSVHHFNLPMRTKKIDVLTQAVVELVPFDREKLNKYHKTWEEYDKQIADADDMIWDMLQPGFFTKTSESLLLLMKSLNLTRTQTPLETVWNIHRSLYSFFTYTPESTRVDSTIDEAIEQKKGVCQDYAHVMIAILRELKISARYVSGYLYQEEKFHDISIIGASHAWVEVFFPDLGWIGFDPTNNKLAEERHIRLATGRDYKDVPPTRGVYKGSGDSMLEVNVEIKKLDNLDKEIKLVEIPRKNSVVIRSLKLIESQQQQQQQQQ